jgi:hypothetical protein
MGAGDEQVLDPIILFGRGTREALAAAPLPPIGRDRGALM